jgi:hypothetical protein
MNYENQHVRYEFVDTRYTNNLFIFNMNPAMLISVCHLFTIASRINMVGVSLKRVNYYNYDFHIMLRYIFPWLCFQYFHSHNYISIIYLAVIMFHLYSFKFILISYVLLLDCNVALIY